MSQIKNPEFKAKIDAKLDKIIDLYLAKDPHAQKHFEMNEMNRAYYVRQVMEIILRIRLRREIHALTIKYLVKRDPRTAATWAKYTEEEMLHDNLFAMDLERFGVPREAIEKQEPFLATKLLQGYFLYTMETEGPLCTFLYSYAIEYVTSKTTPVWLDRLEKAIGKEMVIGQRAHLNFDNKEDHSHVVWNVTMTQVGGPEDERRAFAHLDILFGLIAGYSQELYVETIQNQSPSPLDTVGGILQSAAGTRVETAASS
jgi:hypothetical protein